MITVTNHRNWECIEEPFETPQTLARADWYGVYGIPDVRIDGKYSVIGAVGCPNAYQAYLARVTQRVAETGGLSPIEIAGEYDKSGGVSIQIVCTFRLVDPVALSDLRSTILVYEDGIYAEGEFFYGDTWNRVTRVIYDQPIVLSGVGDEAVVGAELPLDPAWNPEMLRVVAYVQRTTGDREIHQAAFLSEGVCAADPPRLALVTGIESASPNPFQGSVGIALSLSPAAAASPIRLEVFDASGRRVVGLFEGIAGTRRPTWSWDGRLSSGDVAGSGIYFARLATSEGHSYRKLIRLRP